MTSPRSLRVGQTLRPDQRGTRRYVERFGDRPVCVRYRYDKASRRRVTTVEVAVRVTWGEAETARRAKRAGGEWHAGRKRWLLPYRTVERLGYVSRAETRDGHYLQRRSLHPEMGHQI